MPDARRLTRDIDIVVRRVDLERIAQAAGGFGLQYRLITGIDMLVRPDQPSGRPAVHMNVESALELGPYQRVKGLRLILLPELIRIKLNSFRILAERLALVRAYD